MEDVDFCNEIMVFEDGKQALDTLGPRLRSGKDLPDIILLDINMPVMDGIELAHTAAAEFPALKILLMTGFAEQRERADSLSDIIVDVVPKPFTLPDIRGAVAEALAA